MRLADGRWLGFADYGDPSGTPVLQFHGLPGSRLVPGDELGLQAARVRLIGVDRPGFGLSDYQSGRRLRDWSLDVRELADSLGLERFSIIGGSAGGPYALACAHDMPDRLLRVAVVNGMAPMNRRGALAGFRPTARLAWWTLRHVPGQCRMFAWTQRRMLMRDPERLLGRMTSGMASQDKRTVADQDVRSAVIAHVAEAYRSGWRGVAHDMRLVTRPWGFRPRDIRGRVHLWQGEDDLNVPRQMGEYLAGVIPDCRARFLPAVGHLITGPGSTEIMSVLSGVGGGAPEAASVALAKESASAASASASAAASAPASASTASAEDTP